MRVIIEVLCEDFARISLGWNVLNLANYRGVHVSVYRTSLSISSSASH
ncbi:hypothetical protein IC007_1007 [Sulfuracidifex tepidarius]|uniref:Uncharacterized protein n=1 Tax=Sulfuracidifex tepidarius TaxID=1294262 RepID=A0A510E1X6_9CREN|nr:hypothetical protein IC007_1007 [Sulfuracidifex tepidarius]